MDGGAAARPWPVAVGGGGAGLPDVAKGWVAGGPTADTQPMAVVVARRGEGRLARQHMSVAWCHRAAAAALLTGGVAVGGSGDEGPAGDVPSLFVRHREPSAGCANRRSVTSSGRRCQQNSRPIEQICCPSIKLAMRAWPRGRTRAPPVVDVGWPILRSMGAFIGGGGHSTPAGAPAWPNGLRRTA